MFYIINKMINKLYILTYHYVFSFTKYLLQTYGISHSIFTVSMLLDAPVPACMSVYDKQAWDSHNWKH